MSYILKTNLANRSNYGSSRNLGNIKYIVIHYTANDGDTDENNGKYFKNNIVKASAHYFVDDDSVTQSVPDNYIAWSVGGSKYNNSATTGGGSYYGKCGNANSISIELCDDVKNGVIYPSAKTIENAIELTKALMKKYGISQSNVIRHFDVTGKACPAYWCGSSVKNNNWKTEFFNKLSSADPVVNESFKARVTITDLNIRTGAGTNYAKVGYIKPGVYTITEVKSGKGSSSGWGKLKSGAGWISLDYATRL